MRTIILLAVGILLGVAMTLSIIEVSGGRYAYTILPRDDCETSLRHVEVVPNQPNPCQIRSPRW